MLADFIYIRIGISICGTLLILYQFDLNRHIENKISISPYLRPAVADLRHVSTFLYLFFLGGVSKAFEKITETKLFYYE